jgi:hypothetical protein
MVVEKLVEYYLVFLAYYFDGTFHYSNPKSVANKSGFTNRD